MITQQISLGITDAILSAVGTFSVGVIVWKQLLNLPALIGITLIVVDAILFNPFSAGAHES